MSGLCGWIGRLPDGDSPEEVLRGMARGLPVHGACQRKSYATRLGGLCLNARAGEGHWHEEGKVFAAIEGYPHWSNDSLVNLAANSGHGRALIHAYREHGIEFLSLIRGAYALAILDIPARSLLLAIDRTGISPMCYSGIDGGELAFGSTVGSVAAHPSVEVTISPQSLFNFLYFVDRVPAPHTIYKEQAKLAPGQYLHATRAGLLRDYYWRLPYSEDCSQSAAELREEMFQCLRTAVARATPEQPSTRHGVFLSGGLDSSTVAGLLAERSAGPAKTFTIGFENETFDESRYAKLVAEKFGAAYHEYRITGADVLDLIPKIAKIYDEPFSNHSAIPTYYCAKLARESGVDLLLAGDGGDELFAGNTRYVANRKFDHYARIPRLLRTALIEPVFRSLPSSRRGFVSKVNNYIRVANMSVATRMYWPNLFDRVPMDTIFAPELFTGIDPDSPVRLVDEIYDSTTDTGEIKRMMHVDLRIAIADGDVRKVNRMCELAGVRVRYPFLDDDVVEFSGRVPERLLVKDGRLRYFFKAATRDFLPREVIEKKKHGFGLPIADLSDQHKPLLDFACDCVADLKRRGYFQAGFLDKLIDQHRGIDHGFFRLDVFEFVFFELWHKYHVDSRG